MTSISKASDVIGFHNIETGGNSAGNGGVGDNDGKITTEANVTFPCNERHGRGRG